jgi:hypothetical protein
MQKNNKEELEQAVLEAVEEVNIERAIKGEPCYNLADILAIKNLVSLRELAKLYVVHGYSKMNKPSLISAIIKQMIDVEILAGRLLLVSETEWELFQQAVKVKQLVPDNFFADSHIILLKLSIMELYFHNETLYCIIPTEIKETYKELENTGFIEKKEHVNLLNKYAIAATHLYGIISQEDFVRIFNSQNEQQTTVKEVNSVAHEYAFMKYGYILWNNYLVNDDFREIEYEGIECYVEQAKRYPRYIPAKEQFLEYSDWDYFDETPQVKRVREYVNLYFSDNSDKTEAIIEDINYINLNNQ